MGNIKTEGFKLEKVGKIDFKEGSWDIPLEIQKCYTLISKGFSTLTSVNSIMHWHIGRILSTLLKRKSDAADVLATEDDSKHTALDKQYATLSVYTEIKQRTGYSRSSLTYAKRFFETFKFEDVQTLCNKGVSWAVLKDLARIDDISIRSSMIVELRKDDLDKEGVKKILYDYLQSQEPVETTGTSENISETSTSNNTEEQEHTEEQENTKESSKRYVTDTEKYFFDIDCALLKFNDYLDIELMKLPDHLEAKDNERLHEDETWELINNILDKLVLNSLETKQKIKALSSQVSSNLASLES